MALPEERQQEKRRYPAPEPAMIDRWNDEKPFTRSSSSAKLPAADRSPAMTRGRPPVRALQRAAAIAENRGEVGEFTGRCRICSFVIYSAGLVSHARVKRMRHLRCTLGQLEREAGDELAALRMIASSPGISRELWVCSPRQTFRFFRITDNGLVELDRDGRPLPEEVSFTRKRQSRGTAQQTSGFVGEKPAVSAPAITSSDPESLPSGTFPVTDTAVGDVILQGHSEGEKT